MKRVSILLSLITLSAILVLVAVPIAFAGGYLEPTSGENPHGNYSTVGDKCKVCHAVHNARSSPAQVLLRGSKTDACEFCHITNQYSIKQPYGKAQDGGVDHYKTELDTNHADLHRDIDDPTLIYTRAYNGCVSCHSVHGADTILQASKILKSDPGKGLDPAVNNGKATDMETFCRDCHDKRAANPSVPGDKGNDCFSTCHDGDDGPGCISPTYQLTTRDGVTHIMTDTLNNPGGKQVAIAGSKTCKTCHSAGDHTPFVNGDSFPHYTPNAVQFLQDGYATQDVNLDQVCVRCHQWNSGNEGVGKTF